MAGTITIPQMIDEMDKGSFFSIEYCTANVATGKGGVLIAKDNVLKLTPDIAERVHTEQTPKTGRNKKPRQDNEVIKIHLPMEPLKKDRIRSVHLYLITKFNGKDVA